jgi:hypothetical protein
LAWERQRLAGDAEEGVGFAGFHHFEDRAADGAIFFGWQ